MAVPDLSKTKICAYFLSGTCFLENCTYAHGVKEMRKTKSQSRAAATAHPTPWSPAKPTLEVPEYSLDSRMNNLNFAFGTPVSQMPGLYAAAEQNAKDVFYGAYARSPGGVQWQHAQAVAAVHAQALAAAAEQEKVRQTSHEAHLLQSVLIQMEKLVPTSVGGGLAPTDSPQPEEQRKSANLHQIIQRYPKQPEVSGWVFLAAAVLKSTRRSYMLQYKYLRACDRIPELSQLDEDEIEILFLRDATWVPMFPSLAHRCSVRLAQRLRQVFQETSIPKTNASCVEDMTGISLSL